MGALDTVRKHAAGSVNIGENDMIVMKVIWGTRRLPGDKSIRGIRQGVGAHVVYPRLVILIPWVVGHWGRISARGHNKQESRQGDRRPGPSKGNNNGKNGFEVTGRPKVERLTTVGAPGYVNQRAGVLRARPGRAPGGALGGGRRIAGLPPGNSWVAKNGYNNRRGRFSIIRNVFMLQKEMKKKNGDKAKRLFSPGAKEVAAKFARTGGEVQGDGERQGNGYELLDDLYGNMDIPTTPSKTEEELSRERELASIDMMIDSPISREGKDLQESKGSQEEGLRGPGWKEAAPFQAVTDGLLREEGQVLDEEPDWRIPPHYRLDWFSARVEFIMAEMDIVGGLYVPVFITAENTPVKTVIKKLKVESPGGEVSSFFKLKARRSVLAQGLGGPGGGGVAYEYEAECVQDGHIKTIEVWNQSKEDSEVTNCIEFLKMIGKVRAKNSSYAGKMAGGAGYEKLWSHALRKLVGLAARKWTVPTALPLCPLIRIIRSDSDEVAIHPVLRCPMEDTLIRAFATCNDERGRELAVDYWASLVDTHDAVTGENRDANRRRIYGVIQNGPEAWEVINSQGSKDSSSKAGGISMERPGHISSLAYKGSSLSAGTLRGGLREIPVGFLSFCLRLYYFVYRLRGRGALRKDGWLYNLINMTRGVSEKMADSLIAELLVEGKAPKEVRLRYLRNAQTNAEDLQDRVRSLMATITRNQGDAALKRLALEGAKRLTKALDAYGILLTEGGKYLEGKCGTPPSFKHIFKGTNSSLLPAALAVWSRKTEEQKKAVLTDMMVQEFWAAFFREAQGTHYLVKATRPDKIGGGRGGKGNMERGQVWPAALGGAGSTVDTSRRGKLRCDFREQKSGLYPDPGGFLAKDGGVLGFHINSEKMMCSPCRRGHGAGLNAADDGSIQKLRERLIGCLGTENYGCLYHWGLVWRLVCGIKGGGLRSD